MTGKREGAACYILSWQEAIAGPRPVGQERAVEIAGAVPSAAGNTQTTQKMNQKTSQKTTLMLRWLMLLITQI